MINTLLGKVFGTKNEREVKRLLPRVTAINALEAEMQKLSDDQLRAKTEEFRARIQARLGAILDEPLGDDPDRPDVPLQNTDRQKEIENQRCTIPSNIGLEKMTNPFLRPNSKDIQKSLDMEGAGLISVFAKMRELKDNF